jgi:predicted amidohydrolase
VATNIVAHGEAVVRAAAAGVAVVVFPELSLTGYEPRLAAELAVTAADARLDVLQQAAERHQITLSQGKGLSRVREGALW